MLQGVARHFEPVKVACLDINGVEHAVEVTAETLYEPVAMGLAALRNTEWVADLGHGQTTITVSVRHPEVDKVRMRDFESWLQSAAHSPAEMTLKTLLRKLLRG
jgi:hypothetical protein